MVAHTEEDDDSQEETVNYKAKYRTFKRKLKFLIYENECFQEALRINQRKMLKVSRDKSFLLDRLLNYEKVDVTSSEGDETESSDDEAGRAEAKRRKFDMGSGILPFNSGSSSKSATPAKKKKPPAKVKSSSLTQLSNISTPMMSDGQMATDDLDRHLESRQRFMDIDKTPPAMPSEMFSNDPSLDSESNEIGEIETSPSNLGEECLNTELILPD
ncbi:INO80 complex subunit E [Nesidiocoris tenuis]|uniref:INO80 complex subunit E n=1 Tax=Nesidiocoris tenuis TaxID=355587 RepID=A0ABN7B2G8_9HEMI|nr:INO80 complex subunit E [Nesidiocoris tenuis]